MGQSGHSRDIQPRRQQAGKHRGPDGRPTADPRRQPAGQDLVKEALSHPRCEARSGLDRFAARFPNLFAR